MTPLDPIATSTNAMEVMASPARCLFLCNDLAAMQAQLQGHRLSLALAGPLRDDVSTDEITPVAILSHYDERLAQWAHTGTTVEGTQPIGRGVLSALGVSVLVAGRRYGKGSSREQSPAAEKAAGVRLVIAQSFERIYRQNADNIGLFTSTDFGLLPRIERGEAIGLEDLLAGRDELAAAILRSGGLLRFADRHLRGATPAARGAAGVPRTLFDKILDRHRLVSPLDSRAGADAMSPLHSPSPSRSPSPPSPGLFVRADWRFIHEYYTGMAEHQMRLHLAGEPVLHDPSSIVVFEDHSSYLEESPAHVRGGLLPAMHAMRAAQRSFVGRHGLREYRTLTDAEAQAAAGLGLPVASAGISHAMMIEHHALPGQVVVGTDSHTPHSGALGCVAFGVGTTDMASAFVTGAVRMPLPGHVCVRLEGRLSKDLTAKDIQLHLLALPFIRQGGGIGRVFEFTGEAVAAMSVDERATLTNMTAELGGLTGIVAPDGKTQQFLQERRGVPFEIEAWMRSDEGAVFDHTIEVDVGTLAPMVARPGDPGHGLRLDALTELVRIDIAYGGSCTAGKREDFAHYHRVLAWGLAQGLRVAPHVQLYLQYGTTAVRDWCEAQGWGETFQAVGARVLQPSCGACANCGPGSSTGADQVTVSAINRNFPGRSGPGQVWLASPPTVAASALAGCLIDATTLQQRFTAGNL